MEDCANVYSGKLDSFAAEESYYWWLAGIHHSDIGGVDQSVSVSSNNKRGELSELSVQMFTLY